MNTDEIESNPIMRRPSSQKQIQNNINTITASTRNTLRTPVESISNPRDSIGGISEKPHKIYKPPSRSSSNTKVLKNPSTSTVSTLDTIIHPYKNNEITYDSKKSVIKTINQSHDEEAHYLAQTNNLKNKYNPFITTRNRPNDYSQQYNEKIERLIAYTDDLDLEDTRVGSKYNQRNLQTIDSSSGALNSKQNMPNMVANSYNRMKMLNNSMRTGSPFAYDLKFSNTKQNTKTNQTKEEYLETEMDYYNTVQSKNKNNYLINLEDLMLLEEKLSDIINNLDNRRPIINECFEWWNFYFNCSLCGKLELYFKGDANKLIVGDYALIELLSIMICYDSSYDRDLFNSITIILKSMLGLLSQNFLIICNYILSKVSYESLSNLWVQKLRILTDKKLISKENKAYYLQNYTNEIKSNNISIHDYLRIILKNYPVSEKSNSFIYYFMNVFKGKVTIDILNDLFRTKVIRVANKNASVIASVLVNSDMVQTVSAPYVKTQPIKQYTLVLDLDETLIHFKIDESDDNKGLLRLRPGLFEFLDCVSKYFELIVFTAATTDYADPILDAIEQNRLYFDYRFYRQHAVIFNNDFVKDISRIGRDLTKIIIIDNMPQNFRLQKENGIFIKTFYGEDHDDTALYELIPILTKIAESKEKDIRKPLVLFKDDILKKVSSNIEKSSHA